jgi:hypothetical protein
MVFRVFNEVVFDIGGKAIEKEETVGLLDALFGISIEMFDLFKIDIVIRVSR